ncbi:hypothetical protein EHE21_03155 [Proteus sp. GOKU]|uniref:Uncharacterized protein n=3 Tax=Proteus TaxID=583 RepID=A0A6I7D442_9GAMM|nr:hypothetical protein [Proteus sp. G2672]NBL91801.1 hypothetical protein [Proteus sp. G2673]NBM03363.1 hypothetical protein [Proteus sp. G2671]NBM12569.1 hypothetical protein [Proteus sp. G2670]NBM33934.1 hypothetical protein [Proteus sp. G2664]NBM49155.1 hypothetical protein [Proteus sp. G2666]NBM53930.1 hypothetical protein [Proteus sp. G2669]NBM58263.1 hypothetical protein [Proteus sp. G2667]NBM67192.1 hypothetical protein [Proteus sp. G2663]NBM79169.1 hypothetical protein [Proteus sp
MFRCDGARFYQLRRVEYSLLSEKIIKIVYMSNK